MDEPIEILIAGKTKVFDAHQHRLRSGANGIRWVVDERPSSVAVDPGITRIDRNPADNVQQLSNE